MHFLPFAPCHVLLQPGRDFLGTLACAETRLLLLISKSKGDFASRVHPAHTSAGKSTSERVTRLGSKERVYHVSQCIILSGVALLLFIEGV
jgi:hypothetical protein